MTPNFYLKICLVAFAIILNACATPPSTNEALTQAHLDKLTAEFVISKPLESLRIDVLREVGQEAKVPRPLNTGRYSHESDVITFFEDETGYEGYRRVRALPSDRFIIIGQNRTYEGIRVSPSKSLIRVTNAQTGRLFREELELIRKADPDGAKNLEKRAQLGLIPPFR